MKETKLIRSREKKKKNRNKNKNKKKALCCNAGSGLLLFNGTVFISLIRSIHNSWVFSASPSFYSRDYSGHLEFIRLKTSILHAVLINFFLQLNII